VLATPSGAREGSSQAHVGGVRRPSLCRVPRSLTRAPRMSLQPISRRRPRDLARAEEPEGSVKPRTWRSVPRFLLGNRISVRWRTGGDA
jgi:hypothetical protein